MNDESQIDKIKAAGWAKGYEDGVKNAPQNPQYSIEWAMRDGPSFRISAKAYNEGYSEGQRRIEELQTRQELDRLFDDLMNESRL